MGVYTWGQLRMQLQQSLPGISLDHIDEFLNSRYARILDHTRWLGLEGRAFVQTAAPYQSSTDTVNVTQGSTTITGVGTAWTSGLTGQKFQAVSDGVFYTFTYVSATSATLDRPYEGATNTALGYALFTNIYPLPSDLKEVIQVESADDGFPLSVLSDTDFSDSVGFRDEIGAPTVARVTISPTSLDGASSWQLELYPIPQFAKGYPVTYLRTAGAFDGTNTAAAPLSWVTDAAILAGCRAEMWALQGDQVKVQFYEGRFADEVASMVRADRRKRPPERIQAGRRYTRHRIERLTRGFPARLP